MVLQRLGLLVRRAPWCGRSGRDQLDLATAAAALEIELELFFIGDGVLQLLEQRQPQAAQLPSTHLGWRALSELTRVRAWAQSGIVSAPLEAAARLLPDIKFLDAADMQVLQAQCDRVLVL